MKSILKNTTVKLSLVASLALTPVASFAASAGGFVEGSSESSSAFIEPANVEQQVNRVNCGINFVRLNTDILERMPISEDSTWVDSITQEMSMDLVREVKQLKDVKEDPYYSTVGITNVFLNRPAVTMTPLTTRLYVQLSAIYKNDANAEKNKYKLPDLYFIPELTEPKSYVTFKDEKKVEVIEVVAKNGELYKNVEEATLSLLPEDMQEEVEAAKNEYKEAKENYASVDAKVEAIKAWLDDDKNRNNPATAQKKQDLEIAKKDLETADKEFDAKEEIYFTLLEKGAEAIESNFDPSKIALAKKIDKLLDAVDNNAVGAISMFTSATAHLVKNGVGTLGDEVRALTAAQALTTLVGNQKEFISYRLERMGKGALMALPNIAVGTYYAAKQISLAGEYQQIVKKVLEGAKAMEEANNQKNKENKKI